VPKSEDARARYGCRARVSSTPANRRCRPLGEEFIPWDVVRTMAPAPSVCFATASWPAQRCCWQPASRPAWQRVNPWYRRTAGPPGCVSSSAMSLGSAAIAPYTTQHLAKVPGEPRCPAHIKQTGSACHRPAAASPRRAPGLDAAGVSAFTSRFCGEPGEGAEPAPTAPPRRMPIASTGNAARLQPRKVRAQGPGVFDGFKNRPLSKRSTKAGRRPDPQIPSTCASSSSKWQGTATGQASAKAGSDVDYRGSAHA